MRLLKRQIEDLAAKTVVALEPYLRNAYSCSMGGDLQNPRCFQILGLDILMDEQWNCWLMEVNANPSLNMYTCQESPSGEVETIVSEIDKYIKTGVIQDTLTLLQTAPVFQSKSSTARRPYKTKSLSECGRLK